MDASFLQAVKEFVLFQYFIAEDVLAIMYILCAILIPIVTWYFLLWAVRRYAVVIKLYESGRYSLFFSFFIWLLRKIKFFRDKIDEKVSWQNLNTSQKLKLLGLYIFIVFFAELFLRLMFEYLIAYMQIHEFLKPGLS